VEIDLERYYQTKHPKVHTCHYRKIDERSPTVFYAPRIVTLIGPRLPDQRKLNGSRELRDLYARIVLSLFDHYREFADLLIIDRSNPAERFIDTEEDSAYWLAWCARKETILSGLHGDIIRAILQHLQDFHDGQRDAINTHLTPDDGDDAFRSGSRQPRHRVSAEAEEECYAHYAEMCLLAAIEECDGTANTSEASEKLKQVQNAAWADTVAGNAKHITSTPQQEALRPLSAAYHTLPITHSKYTWSLAPNLDPIPEEAEEDNETPASGVDQGIRYQPLPESWLQCERTTFPTQAADFCSPTIADAEAGVGNSIAEVSELFGHDAEQWQGFTTGATAFVKTHRAKQMNNDASVPQMVPLPKQLLMQIIGPAGAGKSKIIHAFLYLAKRLGIRDSILTMSPGGGAALSVDGITMDSFTWPMKGYKSLSQKDLEDLREKFAALMMIILDEVSFVRHTDLWLLDARLRQIMGKDLPFGGLHVVLFGDFLQVCFFFPFLWFPRIFFCMVVICKFDSVWYSIFITCVATPCTCYSNC
jgi:hypothetical protein